ncbi:MAG: hypothetical protein GVY26_05140 [Bacteroidetes bacterium]|jgi:hypothetical protein|nr:hypothetical protein [Bacteroidota bacterium]
MMFDLAGYLSNTTSSPAIDLASVWAVYDGLLERETRPVQHRGGNLHLSGLCWAESTVDLVDEAGITVTIYGDCYTRINERTGENGRRLHAADVWRFYRAAELDFLGRLKGNFILLISDTGKNETYFIADPITQRPFYYINTRLGLLFSSSLAALKTMMAELELPTPIDHASIIEYYLFDFILGGQTMIQGVRELQAGQLLRVRGGETELTAYSDPYALFALTGQPLREPQAGALLADILKKNITLYTDGPDKTALALTGGYDSRSIAALLGEDFNRYQYYSYGFPQSWDLKIPQVLASENKLHYQTIDLNGDFRRDLPLYALKAIQLGDGLVEASRANYVYVYSNHLTGKESILSGLLGSELIKTPSSRGLYVDEHILSLLKAEDPERQFEQLYDDMIAKGIFAGDVAASHREAVKKRVLGNPLIVNAQPLNKKLFYFILLIGARKYFSKEVRLERFFINNKTPFFDIDFIRALLRTPFPWVYNYSEEKKWRNNLKIYKVYANLISHNQRLLKTISTHGFAPKYLMSKWYYPILAFQFFTTKKKMARENQLKFDDELKGFFAQHPLPDSPPVPVTAATLAILEKTDVKNYLKMNSLCLWLAFFANPKTAVA